MVIDRSFVVINWVKLGCEMVITTTTKKISDNFNGLTN